MIRLESVLGRVRGAGDALFALGVLALVILLVAPLSPALLDAGVALNLGLAATVLVVTLFARDALRFASFPTLLLLTTLFRLALNVSSTRLVLTRGDAGRIIQAFGRVVVQGNYVAGAVVFAILTLVQLLVVAKGAERVAEVAARFTLDALPGKQMSIDADLRNGNFDAAEARRRRRALERESQLYGAMDGAMKFVKGDAVAGIAIVLVNVGGGLASGLARGLSLEAAARRYALLAIGDGLVSQIPALLIAVAAGIAVTRVASEEEGGSLGGEIGRQLLADHRALWAVSALLGALALAPGLPALPFLALSLLALGAALVLARQRAPSRTAAARAAPAPSTSGAAPDEGSVSLDTPVALELADDLLVLTHQDGDYSRALGAALRDEMWSELGIPFPGVSVRGAALAPGGWRLLLEDVPVAAGFAPVDRAVALACPDEIALVGIACHAEVDPLSGERVSVISVADVARAAALAPVRGPLERVAACAALALRRNGRVMLGIQEVQSLLDGLEASSPALVREVSRQLPPALVAEVLRGLVEEEVSIRPLRSILEALLEAGGAARGAAALVDACRRALRRHIAHRCSGGGPIEALLLDPTAEAAVRDAMAGELPALDPDVGAKILNGLEAELRSYAGVPVLLTAQEVRRAVRQLVAPRFPHVPVVAYDELPPELQVRPVGRLALAA